MSKKIKINSKKDKYGWYFIITKEKFYKNDNECEFTISVYNDKQRENKEERKERFRDLFISHDDQFEIFKKFINSKDFDKFIKRKI